MKYCKYCNKELTKNQKNNIYCSQECSNLDKTNKKIKNWLSGEYDGIIGHDQLSKTIREYLIDQAQNKCEICGWGEINLTTKKVPLEIHHIDGNYRNNAKENLQVLCPNCHSLTSNYKALNQNGREFRTINRKNYCIDCGIKINFTSLRCRKCSDKNRVIEKPISRDKLKELIRVLSFVKIGEKFGVTDNSIKKWCIGYNLPSRKKDIKLYSDEEWEKL